MILRCPHCPACANGPMHDLFVESANLVRLWETWQGAITPMVPPTHYKIVAQRISTLRQALDAIPHLEKK